VYSAKDEFLGRTVALKILSRERLGPGTVPDLLSRFLAEARVVASLDHPHIVPVYDAGVDRGVPWIAMKLALGESLDRIIAREGRLGTERVMHLLKQASNALAHAHRKGVIHRDIKPSNILVERKHGDMEHSWLADFGIAAILTGNVTEMGGELSGTPAYMSPEQVSGSPIDSRSDIFALGCVAAEAISGSRCFGGATLAEVSDQIIHGQPHGIAQVGRFAGPRIRSSIEKALAKSPAHRFQSAEEFAMSLNVLPHRDGAANEKLRLAVLPFGNLTGSSEQEYFADGMTEELITQLGRLNPRRLAVIAFTSSMRYKMTPKGIDEIGTELGVDFVLEGSVRRSGNRVRIATQLIKVADQSHAWSGAYNHTIEDIISIQMDVAEKVASSLAVELLANQQEAVRRSSTKQSAAYDAYLKGRYFWNRRTEDGFRRAVTCYEEAIRQDPEYALAYAGLADVYIVGTFYSVLPPRLAYHESDAAATKALTLDPALAEAHASRALARALYRWEFPAAEEGFRTALKLNPSQVAGHYWFAWFLAAMGRFDEAFEETTRALELDPLSLVVNCHKGWNLYLARRYDDAIAQLRNTIEMDPNFALSRYFMGLVYVQKSMYEQAITEFMLARESSTHHPAAITGLAAALSLSGRRNEALECSQALDELALRRYVSPYYRALLCMAVGNKDEALDWLEKSFEERSAFMANIMNDPLLDGIRADPKFDQLIGRVGLPRRPGRE
jgi:serine/threonine protein kinase/Flp pilus assembly protein TadD